MKKNKIDSDIDINKIVEDSVPSSTERALAYFNSHFWVQLFSTVFFVFLSLFFAVAVHLNLNYNRFELGRERDLYYKYLIIFTCIIIIIMIIWLLLINNLIKPVFSIKQEMKEIQDGNLYSRIKIEGSNELWQLAIAYNTIAQNLADEKLNASYQYEERMKAIELKNIAQQKSIERNINTSFVYDTIHYTYENDERVSSELKKDLHNHLHSVLGYISSNQVESINIGTELEWIENYLYIKKIITNNKFNYEIDLDKGLYGWPCTKLFLFPFVENCITHAFKEKESDCLIKIFGSEFQNRLILNIWDNGAGISPDIAKKLNALIEKKFTNDFSDDSSYVTLHNIINRLFAFYGDRMEIKINTMENDGTCITLYLPLPNKFSWQTLNK